MKHYGIKINYITWKSSKNYPLIFSGVLLLPNITESIRPTFSTKLLEVTNHKGIFSKLNKVWQANVAIGFVLKLI